MLYFRADKFKKTKLKTKVKAKVKVKAKQVSPKIAARLRHDPRQPLAQNIQIEGYQFLKVIGRGSFSLVYQCIDLSTNENVVIKEYFPKYSARRRTQSSDIKPLDGKKMLIFKEGIKQFFKEAMALNKICHPNALKTCNVFRANKTTYMVSKESGGHDLKRFLATNNEPLNQDFLYRIFMPVLSALNYLHTVELMHLDVKPANILLRSDGQPLLLDFGAAQTFSSKKRIDQMQTLTHGFAPPEQYDKKQGLGPWTDVYAVAATLYYCISCKIPEKSRDSEHESQLDVQKYGDEYGSKLIRAINRGLSFDPTKRYVSIDELAYDLLAGSPWRTLQDYEQRVMFYDRNHLETHKSQQALVEVLV